MVDKVTAVVLDALAAQSITLPAEAGVGRVIAELAAELDRLHPTAPPRCGSRMSSSLTLSASCSPATPASRRVATPGPPTTLSGVIPISIRRRWYCALALVVAVAVVATGCGADDTAPAGSSDTPRIVVTYSVLGSLVRDAVGSTAQVDVLIPNGADPHEWEPSAKDISRLNKADLVVRNGLGLEGGLTRALDNAASHGVATFTAADHITVRHVGPGEGLPGNDADQQEGAPDPHLWMDPLTLVDVMTALDPVLAGAGANAHTGVAAVIAELHRVDDEVRTAVASLPAANRRLVTGHESLGYFAARYGFTLVGAIVPSLTSQAEVSAGDLARLKKAIQSEHVPAVFTEIGTPSKVAEAIGRETGTRVVELPAHRLPADGRYETFLLDVATKIVTALG
jgi:zinc/manganese transport system substrate-binding protein